MKKAQKSLFFVLFVALSVVILGCGTSGGGGGGGASGGPISGVWEVTVEDDKNDGGNSTVRLVTAEETIDGQTFTTYTVTGTVGNTARGYGGVVTATLTPDADTLAAISKLSPTGAFSFKFQGDGKTYIVEAPISTVTDWGFHRFTVKTEPNVVSDQNIQMRMFIQPAWATEVRFNRERITSFRIATQSTTDGGEGPFTIKFWDIKIIP